MDLRVFGHAVSSHEPMRPVLVVAMALAVFIMGGGDEAFVAWIERLAEAGARFRRFDSIAIGVPIDLEHVKEVQRLCQTSIRSGIIRSAHDCAEGGLGVAVAECCILNERTPRGAHLHLGDPEVRSDFLLFGEDQSRIIVSIDPADEAELRRICMGSDVDVKNIGTVGGSSLEIEGMIRVNCEAMAQAYYRAIGDALGS